MTTKEKIERVIDIAETLQYITHRISCKTAVIEDLEEVTNYNLNEFEKLFVSLDSNGEELYKLLNELNKESQ